MDLDPDESDPGVGAGAGPRATETVDTSTCSRDAVSSSSSIHSPPSSHPRHPSRLDDHDPSTASVSYPTANHASAAAAAAASSSASASASAFASALASSSSASAQDANDSNSRALAHHAGPALGGADKSHHLSFRDSSPNCDPGSLPMTTSSLPQPVLRPTPQGALLPSRRFQLSPGRNNNNNNNNNNINNNNNRSLPPRQSLRSVSNPLDSRSTLESSASHPPFPAPPPPPPSPPQAGQLGPVGHPRRPSVKDLKKRFDQNQAQNENHNHKQSPSPSRSQHHNQAQNLAKPRNSPLIRQELPTKSRPQTSTATAAYTTTPRAGVASLTSREAQTSSPCPLHRSQKSKYVAQDQLSNSSQSFASRVAKPQSITADGASITSKSMTHLPRKPLPETSILPPRPSSPNRSPNLSSDAPCLPLGQGDRAEYNAPIANLEAESTRCRRRTSDSNVPGLLARQRSFTDLNINLPSPTSSWYRRAPLAEQGASSFKPTPRISLSPTPNLQTPPSRIPVSVRRLNSSTNSSPTSTRSNSPSIHKTSQKSGQPSGPNLTTPGPRTPTGRKGPPPDSATPQDNTRRQAYTGQRPSQLSPPLRSSRPRKPVSMASTMNNSRIKESGRGGRFASHLTAEDSFLVPHHGLGQNMASVGLIDFEQRREHIRLAYSRSIRESQVYQENHKEVVERRRRKEADAHARAAAGDISPTSQHDGHALGLDSDFEEDDSGEELDQDASEAPATTMSTLKLLTEALPIAASRSLVASSGANTHITPGQLNGLPLDDPDSPVLCMPGGFPDADSPVERRERPYSMISTVTEFDIEPQIEPPLSTSQGTNISITFSQPRNAHLSSSRQAGPDALGMYGAEMLSPRQVPAATQVSDAAMPLPFPRLEPEEDDSDCDAEYEDVPAGGPNGHDHGHRNGHDHDHDHDDYDPHFTAEVDGVDHADRRCATHYRRQSISGRASTCASSEIETFDDLLYPSPYDQAQSSYDPPGRLTVPSPKTGADRLNRQSVWTDFSIDSMDPSETSNSPTMQVAPYAFDHPAHHHESHRDSHRESADGLSGHVHNGAIPRELPQEFGGRPSAAEAGQPRSLSSRQDLPGINTRRGFGIPYLSSNQRHSINYPPSPTHDPPPIPASGPNSVLESRTSSVLYEQSQYGSTLLNSERESGEFPSHLETPQSLDTTSIETGDQYFEPKKPTADGESKSPGHETEELDSKERRRLIQRRNVIKELVDTEAVFVRDMNIVEEIYKGTAEACPKLDSKTIKLIFRNSDEIIEFHTGFLSQLKDAVAEVYTLKAQRSTPREESDQSETANGQGQGQGQGAPAPAPDDLLSDAKDRTVLLGPTFQSNIEKMKRAHEGFLRNSDQAAKRLIQIQQDSTVNVWLNECNEVAKDLTAAWDLDSLLIKPMQRITKYPNLIVTLLQHTPKDHPDREALIAAKDTLEEAIIEINKTKKNFELVGQIVGRKRKESDVKAGIARAFGKRVDKLQVSGNRPPEDPEYAKLEEKFSDDYLRLQVVLRDVEFYTRQVSAYVHEFLQYLSSIELIMRLQPGNWPELESKWVQFNISIRDLEKVALEQHLAQVRKLVIEPFEQVIKAYGNPSLAMKKRAKRRMVWERSEQLKRAGKTIDPKLKELVEQYEALNETLIKELPKLSALTEKVGNICLGNLINIQTSWYGIWKDKMSKVLGDAVEIPDIEDIVGTFQRDFPYANEHLASISIINPTHWRRTSQSAAAAAAAAGGGDDGLLRAKPRPPELEFRGRCLSINAETAPVLPAPDFGKRHSGSFAIAPNALPPGGAPSPRQFQFRDYYANYQPSLVSPRSVEVSASSRSFIGTGQTSTRPSTGRSFDSGAVPRRSTESAPQTRRDSSATFHSTTYQAQDSGRFSNMFHSALPLPDGPEESQRSSRASSRERSQHADGYNVLWLAASLFEFNIATTKHEAGYPYLTYQAGEIFDVIAEKGELWLAKNQDDPTEQVGWIWSKHFAPLADS